ncbi:MAG: large conductance mechanosensitive channel protein MscL, partial [Acetobacteraceae bacterium]
IVTSLVNGIVMPVVGVLTSGTDFSNLAVRIATDAKGAPVLLKYGVLAQSTVNFLIIAFVIFICVRGINKLKKPAAPAVPAPPPRQEVLLEEIRNLLAKQAGGGNR